MHSVVPLSSPGNNPCPGGVRTDRMRGTEDVWRKVETEREHCKALGRVPAKHASIEFPLLHVFVLHDGSELVEIEHGYFRCIGRRDA